MYEYPYYECLNHDLGTSGTVYKKHEYLYYGYLNLLTNKVLDQYDQIHEYPYYGCLNTKPFSHLPNHARDMNTRITGV